MAGFNITVAGDSAINLEFGNVISEKTNGIIRAAAQTLEADPIDGVIELVPTFCSLMVVYNPCVVGYDELTSQVRGKLRGLVATSGGIHRVVKIPVCYGGDFGPDLSDVAERTGENEFDIPFDRQQLADYLNLDRSALSKELGKMQQDGLIEYHKNIIYLTKDNLNE